MKSAVVRRGGVALPLLIGLVLVAVLIYLSNPAEMVAALLQADLFYVLLAIPFYPLLMLVYTYRWQFIITMMGDHLPLIDAYQAMVAGAFISDYTPARIGDFLKPLMVKKQIDVGKGLASVIVDHWADALTATFLGTIGLLVVLQTRGFYFIFVFLPLFGLMILLTFVLLREDLVMKAVRRINHGRVTSTAASFYGAMGHVNNKALMTEKAVFITLIAWVIFAARIAILIRAFGYGSSLLELILLLPLVDMLSALPFTFSGLGFTEGGMTIIIVSMGDPASVGLSVALIDRLLSTAFDALVGSRFASRLL